MSRVFLRWLSRKRETQRAVLFIEEPSVEGPSLFGPQRTVYLTKALVGDTQRIVVKVECDPGGDR